MSEEITNAPEEQAQQSGIFEPKPPMEIKMKSGSQKAKELVIAAAVILLAAIIIVWVKGLYLRPVKTYYKGLTKTDTAVMCKAFPKWLCNADTDSDTITVDEMCKTIVSSVLSTCGKNCRVSAEKVRFTEQDDAYLQKLEDGIEAKYGKEVDISKGRWVTLNVTYEYSGKKQEMIEYVRLYKINGKWCMLDIPSTEEN